MYNFTLEELNKLSEYEKLEIVMYAMTIKERADKRDLYLLDGAFHRMHRRKENALFSYWKKRLDEDPKVKDLLASSWAGFLKNVEQKKSIQPKQAPFSGFLPDPDKDDSVAIYNTVKNLKAKLKKIPVNQARSTNENEYQKRLELCKGCEYFKIEAFAGTGQCLKCGCSIKYKLNIANEKCPVGKWREEDAVKEQYETTEEDIANFCVVALKFKDLLVINKLRNIPDLTLTIENIEHFKTLNNLEYLNNQYSNFLVLIHENMPTVRQILEEEIKKLNTRITDYYQEEEELLVFS